jgi:uncharacterized protein
MRRGCSYLLAIVWSLGFSAIVHAGPFEDAVAASERGDYATALRLYKAMADQGNGNAQFSLGAFYEQGRGVTKDFSQAAIWYGLAAKQGHPIAQLNLGILYDNGRGLVRDDVLAHTWLSLSAAQGNKTAAGIRDIVARRMTPAQIREAQSLARAWNPP